MRISFDVDDTLVVHSEDALVEPQRVPRLLCGRYRERLRLGAPGLFRRLEAEGWEVCVYTTSDRSQSYLKKWLKFYGIRVRLVVNARRHSEEVVPRFRGLQAPSKHPGLYGIDLHVDDSRGVAIEGRMNHFRTVIVDPCDADWTEKVLAAVARVPESRRKLAAMRRQPVATAAEPVGRSWMIGVPGHAVS